MECCCWCLPSNPDEIPKCCCECISYPFVKCLNPFKNAYKHVRTWDEEVGKEQKEIRERAKREVQEDLKKAYEKGDVLKFLHSVNNLDLLEHV